MSVVSIASTARQVSFEMGMEAVKLVGPLSKLSWAASRVLVTQALTTVPGCGESMAVLPGAGRGAGLGRR